MYNTDSAEVDCSAYNGKVEENNLYSEKHKMPNLYSVAAYVLMFCTRHDMMMVRKESNIDGLITGLQVSQ